MIINCPACGHQMAEMEHGNKNEHYFLCTVDTGTSPVNIDISKGIAVDAYGCTSCGTIMLNSKSVIGQPVHR